YATAFPQSEQRARADADADARGEMACACLPLVAGQQAIGGLIFAFDQPHEFTSDERSFLGSIARQCAHAIGHLRLLESLERERARTTIHRQVQHLVRLVDDLLDVSRITRGKVTLRRAPVELADAVWQAVEAATPLVVEHSHRLNVDVPAGIIVDADFDRLS